MSTWFDSDDTLPVIGITPPNLCSVEEAGIMLLHMRSTLVDIPAYLVTLTMVSASFPMASQESITDI
jgi:hypothetical protein